MTFEGADGRFFFVGKAGLCRKNHDTYADFCDILSVFSRRNDIFYCKFSVILSLWGKDWRSAKRRKNGYFVDLFKNEKIKKFFIFTKTCVICLSKSKGGGGYDIK